MYNNEILVALTLYIIHAAVYSVKKGSKTARIKPF
jgi:hypothetical protein